MARAWVFGDNISTDDIVAGRYLVKREPGELAKHVMEAVDREFASRVKKGDVIVAGKNFGMGSSREHAPIALKAAGVSAVIAQSFARIFYRNSINQGLPVLTSKEARAGFSNGDEIKVDVTGGSVSNLTTGKAFKAEPLPKFVMDILKSGGLLDYLKRSKGRRKA